MPRHARAVAVGHPHHVTQRGNNHQVVFFGDEDRRRYLDLLANCARREDLVIRGFCLMENHLHLIVIPMKETSLSRGLGILHGQYAIDFNHRRNRGGHVWQDRFYSCVLEEPHYWSALKYVDQNPVRARMVAVATDYPWSSARAHCSGLDSTGVLDLTHWKTDREQRSWRETLREALDEKSAARLRSHTRSGRPLGSSDFIEELERELGRPLRRRPRGRPRNSSDGQ